MSRGRGLGLKTLSLRERIGEQLDIHEVCSGPALAEALDVYPSTMRRKLIQMVAEGAIERHPMAQQCYRRIKKNTPSG